MKSIFIALGLTGVAISVIIIGAASAPFLDEAELEAPGLQ